MFVLRKRLLPKRENFQRNKFALAKSSHCNYFSYLISIYALSVPGYFKPEANFTSALLISREAELRKKNARKVLVALQEYSI